MEDFGLGEDSCSRFGVWDVSTVPNAPNISIFGMAHGVLIAVEISSSVSQTRLRNILMRGHRRHNMQKIEPFDNKFLGIQILKGSRCVGDLDEGVFEGGLDAVVCGYLLEGFGVLGYAEHDCACFDELDFDWQLLALPRVGPEVEDFLGCPCAFYG